MGYLQHSGIVERLGREVGDTDLAAHAADATRNGRLNFPSNALVGARRASSGWHITSCQSPV